MCLFCKIARHEARADIVFEDDELVAFRDIAPRAPTHVLVIPKRHIASLDDVDDADGALLGKLVQAARRAARENGLGAGWRLVVNTGPDAGQSVPHVHVHVLGGRSMGWPPG
jgi:histidine triad (HIT) family protein